MAGRKQVSALNRAQTLDRLKKPVVFPTVHYGQRFLRAAQSFGWVTRGMDGGVTPIPLSQILSAVGVSGSPLVNWKEAELVFRICRAFYNGLQEGENPFSIEPWNR